MGLLILLQQGEPEHAAQVQHSSASAIWHCVRMAAQTFLALHSTKAVTSEDKASKFVKRETETQLQARDVQWIDCSASFVSHYVSQNASICTCHKPAGCLQKLRILLLWRHSHTACLQFMQPGDETDTWTCICTSLPGCSVLPKQNIKGSVHRLTLQI